MIAGDSRRMFRVVMSIVLLLCLSVGTALAGECDGLVSDAEFRINQATKTKLGETIPLDAQPGSVVFSDWIGLKLNNLQDFLKKASCSQGKTLLLVLNGQQMKGVDYKVSDQTDWLLFRLTRNADNRNAWGNILGFPNMASRPVRASVAIPGHPSVVSDANAFTLWPIKAGSIGAVFSICKNNRPNEYQKQNGYLAI